MSVLWATISVLTLATISWEHTSACVQSDSSFKISTLAGMWMNVQMGSMSATNSLALVVRTLMDPLSACVRMVTEQIIRG